MTDIEGKVLRELRSKHSLSELSPEQRQELRMFCDTWEDILANLSDARRVEIRRK